MSLRQKMSIEKWFVNDYPQAYRVRWILCELLSSDKSKNADFIIQDLLDALCDCDFLKKIEDKASQASVELAYTFLESFGIKQKSNVVYKYAYPFTEADEIQQNLFMLNNC